jgi:hypothetical protein
LAEKNKPNPPQPLTYLASQNYYYYYYPETVEQWSAKYGGNEESWPWNDEEVLQGA